MRQQRWPAVGSLVSLVLVLLLLIAGADTFHAAPRTGAFTLAVLRRDGILLPFADYDGKHWNNRWPSPGEGPDMPISFTDIPKGWWLDKRPTSEWTLFPLSPAPAAAESAAAAPAAARAGLNSRGAGGNSANSANGGASPTTRTVHAKRANWFLAGCERAVGLLTDYKPAILPPPARVHPYPKDALAFNGDVQIAPIEIVDPKDTIVKVLTDALAAEVTPKENQEVERLMKGRWRHSYTQNEREKTPVSLEALYRVPKGFEGRDIYYYEAVKRYFLPKASNQWTETQLQTMAARTVKKREPREPTCDLVTFTRGWFTPSGASTLGDLHTTVTVTSCDYERVHFMLPLGTVTIDGDHLWIVQWSNPTSESYMIMRPTTDKLESVLEAPGGNCVPDEG